MKEKNLSKCLVTKEWLEANKSLVTMKESKNYPGLFVIKYKNKVFYDNLWTPELQQCRGLVLDAHYNVVVRPFDKIFNYMENGTTFDRDDVVTYTRKVNGFMGAMTYSEDHGYIYSTTGSLDSDFALLVKKHLQQYEQYVVNPNFTLLFEICDPSDPHIIKEDEGAYLIGCVFKNGFHAIEYDLDCTAETYGMKRFKSDIGMFSDVVKLSKECKHEGYVVRLFENQSKFLKLKSPYYLVTKFLARKKGDNLIKMLDNINETKKSIDEEYYPLLEYLSSINETFTQLTEQERIEVIEDFFQRQ